MSTRYSNDSSPIRTRYTGSAALLAAIRAVAVLAPEIAPHAEFPDRYRSGRYPFTVPAEYDIGREFRVGPITETGRELITSEGPACYWPECSQHAEAPGPFLLLPADRRVTFHHQSDGSRGSMSVANVRADLLRLADKVRANRAVFDGKVKKTKCPAAVTGAGGSAPHVAARALWAAGDYAGAIALAQNVGAVFVGAGSKPGERGCVYMRAESVDVAGHAFVIGRSINSGKFRVVHVDSGLGINPSRLDDDPRGYGDSGFVSHSAALDWVETAAQCDAWRDKLDTAIAQAAPLDQNAALAHYLGGSAYEPAQDVAQVVPADAATVSTVRHVGPEEFDSRATEPQARAALESEAWSRITGRVGRAARAEDAPAVPPPPVDRMPVEPVNSDRAAALPPTRETTNLNAKRAAATLDKPIRRGGEIMTRREFVALKIGEGLRPTVAREDRIQPMTRMQFFRATNEEQRAHDARIKAAGQTDVFYLDGFEITKTEYDHALTLIPADPVPVNSAPLPAKPEALPRPCDRPMAGPGLTSYRARSPYGWIMIGARDDVDAMREARRSTDKPTELQVWDGGAYVPCGAPGADDPHAPPISAPTSHRIQDGQAVEFKALRLGDLFRFDAGGQIWLRTRGGYRAGLGSQLHAFYPRAQVIRFTDSDPKPAPVTAASPPTGELKASGPVDDGGFSQRVTMAATYIGAGRKTSRAFDSCFEMWDGAAVSVALLRRAENRPGTKLAANLWRYLSRATVEEAASRQPARSRARNC